MNFHFRVQENTRFTLLINDVIDGNIRIFKSPDDVIPISGNPKVNVPAHPPLRMGIEMSQSCPLQDTAMKAQPAQKGLQLGNMPLVNVINPANLGSILIPFFQQTLAWSLVLRYSVSRFVQNTHQGLLSGLIK